MPDECIKWETVRGVGGQTRRLWPLADGSLFSRAGTVNRRLNCQSPAKMGRRSTIMGYRLRYFIAEDDGTLRACRP